MKRKAAVWIIIFVMACGIVYGATLPRDMRQKLENIRAASTVYDCNGQAVGNLYYYNRVWVPIQKIGVNLQNAVISIEDARFYQHNGIDLKGIARAVINNIIPGGNQQGGSTITQQLAKIVLLSSERTISRKIQDMTYAMEIEQTYTKKEILEMYLNSIYLGHGNVGVEAASRYYFRRSANALSLEQAAYIAAIIQSPEHYSNDAAAAKTRRNTVLQKMAEYKHIPESQSKAAISRGLGLVGRNETIAVGGYFLDYVKEQMLKSGITEEELRLGGYKIYTTLDLTAQRAAEQTMMTIPTVKNAKTQPQGALVSLNPKTGGIIAMVGGKNYAESQLNRAVKAYRQPGSAIKPFVYATAMEKGFTAASAFEDQPLSIPLPNGQEWKPENYDHTFRGKLTLREALRNSVNTVAVQLLQSVGVDAVVEQMERMGINSLVKQGPNNDMNLAPLALGGLTKGVTPLELAASYTPFPNQGIYAKPYAIVKVLDRQGNVLRKYGPTNKPVLSAPTAFIMTMLMKDVVDQGTGQRARQADQAVAGKTGTSSDYTNAWFVGFTPDLVTVVWLGNDKQSQAMSYKGYGNIGSASAAELWGSYMRRGPVRNKTAEFSEPPGVIWADVNPKTGQAVPPGPFSGPTYLEVFNEENIPASGAYKFWHWFFPGRKPKPTEAPGTTGTPAATPGITGGETSPSQDKQGNSTPLTANSGQGDNQDF